MKPTVPPPHPLALAAIVAACALLAGCDAPSQPPQTPPSAPPGDGAPPASSAPTSPSNPPPESGSSATPAMPAPSGPDLPKPSEAEATAVGKASNAFAFDFYKPISKKAGNLAYSPASITAAIAMTWGGAVGPTSDEMRKVMHFAGPTEQVLGSTGKLIADLQRSAAPAPSLAIANRLFGEKTFTFQKTYLDSTESTFGAPLEPLDFVGSAAASRKHINDWVAGRTRDRIKDLLPTTAIDRDTRLVLVNAVYFLGDWDEPFKKSATSDAPFFADGKTEKQVPTMRRADGLPFAEVDGTQLVELPYVGGRFAMLLAVPGKQDGLPALEASLDAARYDKWVKALASERVTLSLPKFELDPPESVALKDVFLALGMKTAFNREKADFTKIANPPSPADRLFIGEVFHKAFVKVDEKGTEAAAATAVVMPRAGSAAPPKPPREVKVDRPFLFFLRDRQSGLILFAGRVVDPSKKG